ncbi:MAG TPA: hypothetical protein DDW65_19480, partial [Firmicutes bacterium]|nr:hypothetical protein [Bacillota bacterium]
YVEFVKEFNIQLEDFEVSRVFITCKHITTFHDGGAALKKYGLLNLKEVFEKDTPLKIFLAERMISIDVDNRKLIFDGQYYPLFSREEKCPVCFDNNDAHGNSIHSIYEYHEAMILLNNKLSYDKGEIEVFIGNYRGPIEEYSCVKKHSEILNDIDHIIGAISGTTRLSKEWEELQRRTYYILEFDLNISSFENVKNYKDQLIYLGYKIDFEKISQGCLFNIFLIKNSINVITDRDREEYGQILPTVKISYDDLHITKRTWINEE